MGTSQQSIRHSHSFQWFHLFCALHRFDFVIRLSLINMQFLTVIAAAAVTSTVVAVQPVVQDLEKKSPGRHGRWWRWRHRGDGNGTSTGGIGQGFHAEDGEAVTEVYTSEDPMTSSISISTTIDEATPTKMGYVYGTDMPLPSTSTIISSTALTSAAGYAYSYPNTTETYVTSSSSASSSVITSKSAAGYAYSYPNTTEAPLPSTLPASSSVISSYSDPNTTAIYSYSYPNTTETSSLPASSSIVSSYSYPNTTAVYSYSYPNTTEAPVTSSTPASSSTISSYGYPNTTHTYSYPNTTSAYYTNSSTALSTSTPGCSVTASTSTLTITESITTTFTYTTSASNYTWLTSIPSTSQSSVPYPNITSTFNSSQPMNFTTFTANSFVPTTVLSTTTDEISSSAPATSSEAAIETSTFTESALPTSIFVSADPIFVAPTTAVLHPSTTASQTTTVAGGEATGIPDPTAFHCGVHGLPIGLYKMAEYWEEREGVDVTLEGCYEFCAADSEGCFSYSFYYEEGLGDARCDLFGGSVADSLDSIIPEVPRVWYDIGCGNPLLLD